MGFLQGIIADARSSASGPMIDGSMPSVVESSGGWNPSPTGGIEHGKTGMGESRSEGSAVDSGAGSATTYREASIYSSPATEASRPSRSNPITTENVMSVFDRGENRSLPSAGNVEHDESGMLESRAVGNSVDSGVESSMVYREPSVFSAPPAETGGFSRIDNYAARIGMGNRGETASGTTWPADGVNDPESQDRVSIAAGDSQEFNRPQLQRQVRSVAVSPAPTGRAIEIGLPDSVSAFDRMESVRPASGPEDARAPQFFVSKALPTGDGARAEPLLQEAGARPLSDSRGIKHAVQPKSAAKAVPGSIFVPERELQPSAYTGPMTMMEPSRRSARTREERPVKEANGEAATGSQVPTAQHQAPAKHIESDGKAGMQRIKAEVHQRELISPAGKRSVAAQAELPAKRHAHQDRGWSAGVIAPPPMQKAPEVKIGQVDIFIEAPRKAAASDRTSHQALNTLSSRCYLRRI